MRPKREFKDLTSLVLKDYKPTDLNRKNILKKARKSAHSPKADMKCSLSKDIKRHSS